MSKRIAYVCRDCGSVEVRVDAFAAWNVELQRNELTSELDTCYCEGDNGETCNGGETKCEEVSADQDCRYIEDPDHPGLFLIEYDEAAFQVTSLKAAQKIQRDWRLAVGRHPETGEPVTQPLSLRDLAVEVRDALNDIPRWGLNSAAFPDTYRLVSALEERMRKEGWL